MGRMIVRKKPSRFTAVNGLGGGPKTLSRSGMAKRLKDSRALSKKMGGQKHLYGMQRKYNKVAIKNAKKRAFPLPG